jgi:hypothetical protein
MFLRGLECLHRSPASRRRRQKGNMVREGVTRLPSHGGVGGGGGVGHKADDLALQNIIVAKSKDVKTGWSNSNISYQRANLNH